MVELVTSLRYSTRRVPSATYPTILQWSRLWKGWERQGWKEDERDENNEVLFYLLVDLGKDPAGAVSDVQSWDQDGCQRTRSPGRGCTPPRRP